MTVFLTTVPQPVKRHPILPIGLLRLRTALRDAGIEVRLFDANIEQQHLNLLRGVRDEQPDLIGISMRNVDSCDSWNNRYYVPPLQQLVGQLRERGPRSTILVGGSGYSLFPEEILRRIPEIDVGLAGEGEERIVELARLPDDPSAIPGVYVRRRDRILVGGTPAPVLLDQLPVPAIDRDELRPYTDVDYQIGIETRRGCDFACAYCTYPRLQGRTRLFPVDAVLDTIEHFRSLGMRSFHFTDSIFNHPLDHAKAICRGMADRGWTMTWGAFCNESFVDEELLDLMKRTGCGKIDYGLDGADDHSLRQLGKSTTMARALHAYELTERAGLNYTVSLFLSHPFTGPRSYLQTLALGLRVLRRGKIVQLSNIRIYPETPMARLAAREGLIDPGDSLLEPVYYDRFPYRIPNAVVNLAEALVSRLARSRIA